MPKDTSYQAKQPDSAGFIHYTQAENNVWRDLVKRQQPNVERYAAKPYLEGQKTLSFPIDRVPQCKDVSRVLLEATGWRVEPVPALIGFEKFFGMLAQKVFPAASFIRSREDFDYIEEPDIFHEIYGHTPLLTHPEFAAFSQAIGQTGLRCDKSSYSWLIRLYWFTIEFGLIKEKGQMKALGSGLASSPGELVYAIEDTTAERKPFNVLDILRTPYRIDINQPIYFVLDNVEQLLEVTDRDILTDIEHAQSLGLFAPTYPPKA